jgi:hypothetical protein
MSKHDLAFTPTLTGSLLIESVGGDRALSERINFGSSHNNRRGLAVNYCGRWDEA